MRDIPIIFSAPMVQALMDGRKTMTRRLAASPLRKAKPGDRLWVRENFSGPYEWRDIPPSGWGWDAMVRPAIWYWADGNPENGDWMKPRPSIHMPRWASRLTLIVTGTRIESLHDISAADAAAEGHRRLEGLQGPDVEEVHRDAAMDWFSDLWVSLHGTHGWNSNPDVVAVSFRVIKANVDAAEALAA